MSARLSLRDKLALIYTSAGSQRNVAALVGISHQKVGRLLHEWEHGGYKPDSRVWSDPDLNRAVDLAFSIHADIARDQARADGLPFDPAFPVYRERLPMHHAKRTIDPKTGLIYMTPQFHADGSPVMVPGLRAVVKHAHWISDDLRGRILAHASKSRAFHNVSAGTWLDLKSYFKQGEQYWKEQNKRNRYRSASQIAHRKNLQRKIRRGQQYGFVYTPMIPLEHFDRDTIMGALNRELNRKHAPAQIDPQTRMADQLLFQIKHQYAQPDHDSKAKPTQTRGNRRRGGGTQRKR